MFNIQFHKKGNNPSVISFKTMRKMIGFLGMGLPLILFFWSVVLTGNHFLLDSISSYYHTNTRDILVGILCAVAFFLFAYHGYDNLDFIAFKIASFSALGIALFPAQLKSAMNPYIHIAPNVSDVTNVFHFIFAGVFFTTLAFVSLFLFTKTDKEKKRKGVITRKNIRNGVYIACGTVLLVCVAVMAVLTFIPETSGIFSIQPVFWIETVALFAFGISWLVKGELFIKDKKAQV